MKITSNMKGQLAMSKTELRALELGYIPSRPAFDTRYDLIIDDLKSLKRIQVKYADGNPSNSTGAIVVGLTYHTRKRKVYTYKRNEIDGLVVYIPKIDKLCFFPPRIFAGKKALCMRLEKSKNNQRKGIIMANDYFW